MNPLEAFGYGLVTGGITGYVKLEVYKEIRDDLGIKDEALSQFAAGVISNVVAQAAVTVSCKLIDGGFSLFGFDGNGLQQFIGEGQTLSEKANEQGATNVTEGLTEEGLQDPKLVGETFRQGRESVFEENGVSQEEGYSVSNDPQDLATAKEAGEAAVNDFLASKKDLSQVTDAQVDKIYRDGWNEGMGEKFIPYDIGESFQNFFDGARLTLLSGAIGYGLRELFLKIDDENFATDSLASQAIGSLGSVLAQPLIDLVWEQNLGETTLRDELVWDEKKQEWTSPKDAQNKDAEGNIQTVTISDLKQEHPGWKNAEVKYVVDESGSAKPTLVKSKTLWDVGAEFFIQGSITVGLAMGIDDIEEKNSDKDDDDFDLLLLRMTELLGSALAEGAMAWLAEAISPTTKKDAVTGEDIEKMRPVETNASGELVFAGTDTLLNPLEASRVSTDDQGNQYVPMRDMTDDAFAPADRVVDDTRSEEYVYRLRESGQEVRADRVVEDKNGNFWYVVPSRSKGTFWEVVLTESLFPFIKEMSQNVLTFSGTAPKGGRFNSPRQMVSFADEMSSYVGYSAEWSWQMDGIRKKMKDGGYTSGQADIYAADQMIDGASENNRKYFAQQLNTQIAGGYVNTDKYIGGGISGFLRAGMEFLLSATLKSEEDVAAYRDVYKFTYRPLTKMKIGNNLVGTLIGMDSPYYTPGVKRLHLLGDADALQVVTGPGDSANIIDIGAGDSIALYMDRSDVDKNFDDAAGRDALSNAELFYDFLHTEAGLYNSKGILTSGFKDSLDYDIDGAMKAGEGETPALTKGKEDVEGSSKKENVAVIKDKGQVFTGGDLETEKRWLKEGISVSTEYEGIGMASQDNVLTSYLNKTTRLREEFKNEISYNNDKEGKPVGRFDQTYYTTVYRLNEITKQWEADAAKWITRMTLLKNFKGSDAEDAVLLEKLENWDQELTEAPTFRAVGFENELSESALAKAHAEADPNWKIIKGRLARDIMTGEVFVLGEMLADGVAVDMDGKEHAVAAMYGDESSLGPEVTYPISEKEINEIKLAFFAKSLSTVFAGKMAWHEAVMEFMKSSGAENGKYVSIVAGYRGDGTGEKNKPEEVAAYLAVSGQGETVERSALVLQPEGANSPYVVNGNGELINTNKLKLVKDYEGNWFIEKPGTVRVNGSATDINGN
ncbi:MAG TPA: hypothetical protein VLJ10_01300, partial [Candidatus Bathyarchaeia archaeon]|nr:hypothetical protein [Candidatus Bathyarchaeia archaeon]